jgi:hypothetical protein
MLNENLYSSNVGFKSNTDPTYDYSTMGTTQQKDVNGIYTFDFTYHFAGFNLLETA